MKLSLEVKVYLWRLVSENLQQYYRTKRGHIEAIHMVRRYVEQAITLANNLRCTEVNRLVFPLRKTRFGNEIALATSTVVECRERTHEEQRQSIA